MGFMHEERKQDHLKICLEEDVQHRVLTTGLEHYTFIHTALPECSLSEIDTTTTILRHSLRAPLLISAMTGGTTAAGEINRRLATAAEYLGLAMGVGSQRAALDQPDLTSSYQVRDVAPSILLFANLGAAQLNRGYGLAQACGAIDMIGANALMLHLNPLHEALQPDGDTDFSDLLPKIGKIATQLTVPLVVKEVGYGISKPVAEALHETRIAGIDVAGAGGTDWGRVEACRLGIANRPLADAFAAWGIPTAEAIQASRVVDAKWLVIGSGGIRNGVDIAKALALGADMAGIALPLLRAAAESQEAVITLLETTIQELRIAMFAAGARNISDLREGRLIKL
jgi:isopentenyl-diphosphate delta-isomerase